MTTDRRNFLKYTLGSMIVDRCRADTWPPVVGRRLGVRQHEHEYRRDDDQTRGAQKSTAMMPFAVGINFIADTAAAAGGFVKDNGLDIEPAVRPECARWRCSSSRRATST